MKEIMLTQGRVAVVDDGDFERLNAYAWRSSGRYAVRTEDGTSVYMHREIMGLGPLALDQRLVDHRDRNGFNNQRSNLRPCSSTQNLGNRCRRRESASRFKGVRPVGRAVDAGARGWRAEISYDGRKQHLGVFRDEESAARAYDAAALGKWGDFALLNFPAEAVA